MAAPWIKWSKGLTQKREVLLLSAELGINVYEIAGRLMRFWEWLDDNVTTREVDDDGNARVTLGALPLALVNSVSGVTGFGEALASVGWLKVDGRDLIIVNFSRHNGETAKTRAQTAVRVAKHKTTKVQGNAIGNGVGNAQVTVSALPRGEEIREEEREREQPAADALAHERAIIEVEQPTPQKNPAHKGWEPKPGHPEKLVAAVRQWQEFWFAFKGENLPGQSIDAELMARLREGWDIAKVIRAVELTIRRRAANLLDPDRDYHKSAKPADPMYKITPLPQEVQPPRLLVE